MHRYDCAQGFRPVPMRLVGISAEDVLSQAADVLGGPPARQWFSTQVQDWQGPPAIWAQWAA